MQKIRKILEFILALLNFLFHFKPAPDENLPSTLKLILTLIFRKGMNLYLKLSVRIRLW